MGNQAASFIQLYHQALVDPKGLTSGEFEQLLARYPYSQPLYFAFERHKFLQQQQSKTLGSQAVLLANSPNWLYGYVQAPVIEAPVEEVPLVEAEDDDYVPYEDMEASEAETAPTEVIEDEQEIEPTDVQQGQKEQDALETLVQEGIGGGDYFALHAEGVIEQAEEKPAAEKEAKKEKEDISLYNDELMPYSFRWWLHKTRLEHADTYQPFASPHLPVGEKHAFDPAELDRVILDQQIRQHIIHLQNPEDKLSEEVKQKDDHAAPKHRAEADVIERFIREEPQIQPPQPENLSVENKARKSSEEQYDLVTETLAHIYVEQAMYVKAIEVYKKLILRFPEKKSYFAPQIKELEEKLY